MTNENPIIIDIAAYEDEILQARFLYYQKLIITPCQYLYHEAYTDLITIRKLNYQSVYFK
jgi:hypothetical protein